MSQEVSTKVITGKGCTFSFCHVFEPSAMAEGQTEKYSVSLIIPKSDKATIAKIEAAIKQATIEGKASKFGGKIPPNLKTPLRDGDSERPDDEAYADSMFLNANSINRPGVASTEKDEFGNLKMLTNDDEFYSGCIGRASVNFYPYNANGSKGIACGLNNVQKCEEGTRLSGGGASAASDFGDDDDDLM